MAPSFSGVRSFVSGAQDDVVLSLDAAKEFELVMSISARSTRRMSEGVRSRRPSTMQSMVGHRGSRLERKDCSDVLPYLLTD